jgi:hemoglobin
MSEFRSSRTSAPFEYRATKVGLTEPLVRRVILSFYERVRRDDKLGPIFAEAIGANWDTHIERIISFWLTATRLERSYDGRNFMPAHLRNRSIRADQLTHWLELFRETATEQCTTESASVLIDIAERMAETLKIGLDRRDNDGPQGAD